ncbi:YggS family pyridoxal phosphate-dependent enzyme [Christensenellaceae bacterium OttesenSCG-928-M15]|nr:YggS family pyridoxal phosphate-dependent enzyme [Christensenellaceae bacterium OttesenSCG-928-M15]
MNIQENYKNVMDGMKNACEKSGRNIEDVTLIAVTKFVPIERIAPLVELGVRHVGENRVQELLSKQSFFEESGCSMHLIGQLQTNKVKYIVGSVELIQSVDRLSLAVEIEKQAEKRGVVQNILVQVNIGEEMQKGGADTAEVMALLSAIEEMPHIKAQGLMCIPPAVDQEAARPYFRHMRELYLTCKEKYGQAFKHLSMGMSGDFEVAIEEGATMVRVGSALFGARDYH